MKKRRIKSKLTMQELLAQLLRQKPANGHKEEFWVFSVIRNNPNRPTWEERIQILGTYEVCARQCVSVIDAMRIEGSKSIRFEAYQGESAEALLVDGFRQETKYRQEIEAQPNN